jgi:hypothetical protein
MIVQGIETWLLTGDTNDPASTDPIVQLSWFQVLIGYLPHKWNLLQEGFFRSQRKRSQYKTGEQWTNQLITFFWTHSHTLWKDRCAAAHAPGDDSPDNFSARSRQAAQQRVMLAHDRRVLDVPLAERLQSRTSDLIAWAKSMFPVITQSFRDARAQIHTGHQDIRTYLFGATVAGTATTTTPATATATTTARASASLPEYRQRSQHAQTTIATLSTDIRRFFPGRNSAT